METPPSGGQMLEDLSAFPVISQKGALTKRAEVPFIAYFIPHSNTNDVFIVNAVSALHYLLTFSLIFHQCHLVL